MNCKTTNLILSLVFGGFVLLDALFAIITINRSREFRALQVKAFQSNAYHVQVDALANDVAAYNQKNPSPELTKLLQSIQPKPAAHEVYTALYALYRKLHDAFGTQQPDGNLYDVMKRLLEIRARART